MYSLPNGLQSWDQGSSFTGLNLSARHNLNTDDLLLYQPRLFNVSAIWGDYHAQSRAQFRAHQAFDCVFYFCVQIFSGSVIRNNFTEVVKNVYHDPSLKSIDDPLPGIYLNMTTPQGQLPSSTDLTFGVGDAATELYRYMGQQLAGSGGIGVTGVSQWENDVVRGIFSQNSSNFVTTMDNLATAMTNTMRIISGDTAIGTALRNVTYIPMAMIFLASLLLVLTIWQSHHWDVPRWRSSALAVMEHGVQRGEESLSNGVIRLETEKISELET